MRRPVYYREPSQAKAGRLVSFPPFGLSFDVYRNARVGRRLLLWNPVWRLADKKKAKAAAEWRPVPPTDQGAQMEGTPIESRILVVDDDAKSRMAMQELLQAPGRATDVAE